jgi:xanthine dehydrogenase accessory factor
MRILLDPAAARHRECFARAAEAIEGRRRGVLRTEVMTATAGPDGPKTVVRVEWLPEEAIPSATVPPGGEAMWSCLERQRPRLFVDESRAAQPAVEVFVEPVIPTPLLVIAGGGHVGRELADQAVRVGFEVIVLDDRPEFAQPGLFPAGVTARCGNVARELAAFPLGPDTYVAIVTRGHQQDAEALAACLRAPAAYVGMIGSRRKVAMIRKSFLDSGLATEEEFDRVFAPIGLELGAVTVAEIAASIVAQLIAVRRLGSEVVRSGRQVPR